MKVSKKIVGAAALFLSLSCSPTETTSRNNGLDEDLTRSNSPLPTSNPNASPGDFNGDDKVDQADLVFFTENYKYFPQGCAEGDDCDGNMDGSDFLSWQRSVGVVLFREGDLNTDGKIDMDDLNMFVKNPSLIKFGHYKIYDHASGADVIKTFPLVNRTIIKGENLKPATAATKAGDFNRDGILDGDDLSIYLQRFDRFEVGCVKKDFNCDGKVDGADLALWQSGFGTKTFKVGDLNRDNVVNSTDFERYRANPSLLDD